MKFDPEHLRIAAEVRAKAQRRRGFERVGLLFLLITALGVIWAVAALGLAFAHLSRVAYQLEGCRLRPASGLK